jgi:hypothetical protein
MASAIFTLYISILCGKARIIGGRYVGSRSEEQPVEMKCVKCREQRRQDQMRSIANRLSYLVCLDKVLFGKSQFDCVGRAAK